MFFVIHVLTKQSNISEQRSQRGWKGLNHKKIQRETFFKPKTPGKGKSLQSVNKKKKKYFASHAKQSSIFVEGKRNSYLRKKNMFR